MKKNKVLIPLIAFGLSSQAQSISSSVLSSAGKNSNNTSAQLNWTLGEPVVNLMTNNGMQIGSGYHTQLNIELLSAETSEMNITLKIYPNPTSNFIFISKPNDDEVSINIYDSMGKTVIQTEINSKESEIDFSKLSTGIYIVNITNQKSQKNNSYKIIKK